METVQDEEAPEEPDSDSDEYEDVLEEDDEENSDAEEEGEASVYLPKRGLEEGEHLVYDKSAYRMLHNASSGAPCLSFDVIPDDLGNARESFPLSMYIVAGTQASRTHLNNVLVMKMSNLHGMSEESNDESDDESELPVLNMATIKHQGCINRVRCTKIQGTTLAASWSELGRVNVWNLEEQLRAVDDPLLLSAYRNKCETEGAPKPLFTFRGHLSEGYGLDWCSTEPGVLASGDCKGNIHIWRLDSNSPTATWLVDQRPYDSHAPHSVEDLQWSPTEMHVLASCSVDKSIKIWDTRVRPQSACMLTGTGTHTEDINVISWNRIESQFLLSGGDDGLVCVWDLRQFGSNGAGPLATFKQHTAPVTTVEWSPREATVFASGGADDQIAQWDLAVEVDDADGGDSSELGLPPQLLFIHQGQTELKELHWHPQCPGVVVSTAHSGFNVFRTISV